MLLQTYIFFILRCLLGILELNPKARSLRSLGYLSLTSYALVFASHLQRLHINFKEEIKSLILKEDPRSQLVMFKN